MFIHIPKTGGSSLEKHFANRGWREIFSVRGIPTDQIPFSKISPQHFHAELLEQVFDFDAFSSVVTLVRDPLQRLKSEFYWQHRKAADLPEPAQWIDRVFRAAKHQPFQHDNHIRPQCDFFPENLDVRTFKLEDDGVRAAFSFSNEGEDLPKSKSSIKDRLFKREEKFGKKSTYIPEIEAAFEAQRDQIGEFYREDYRRFGYSLVGS